MIAELSVPGVLALYCRISFIGIVTLPSCVVSDFGVVSLFDFPHVAYFANFRFLGRVSFSTNPPLLGSNFVEIARLPPIFPKLLWIETRTLWYDTPANMEATDVCQLGLARTRPKGVDCEDTQKNRPHPDLLLGGDRCVFTAQKTAATVEVLKNEFAGLRTGRASVHFLDGVHVPVYGADMPLTQVATISAPDTTTLSVTVWDASNAAAVEKAIRDSGLGLNPMAAGGVIRINLPPLTEERRKELVKVSGKYAEEAKISMRNIRQDAFSKIKRATTDKLISEDDQRRFEDDLQKVFDARASEVDGMAKVKEQDIMSV